MPAVGLDTRNCSGHGGFAPRPNVSKSADVFINGLGALRVDDTFVVHSSGPTSHTSKVASGSGTVFVNGKGIARNGDPLVRLTGSGTCTSVVANGSPNVNAGD